MIVVTGGTGFVGSTLIDQLLNEGSVVRAIRRPGSVIPPLLQGRPVDWVTADLLDYFSLEEALVGATEVYHCAALVSFNTADKAALHQVNVEGTARIVNFCLDSPGVKLLYTSSVAAIGEAKNGIPATESDFWEFNGRQNSYAISKYEAEMEVWRGIAEGLSAVIVNPSVIIGRHAGDKGSGKIFARVKNGLRYYPGGSVGLVDAADVARALIALMKSDISGQRYILSAGTLTFRELFERIATLLHVPPPSFRLRPWMLSVAWRSAAVLSWFTRRDYELNKATARSVAQLHPYSSARIKEALPGFEFKDLAISIAEAAEAWLPPAMQHSN